MLRIVPGSYECVLLLLGQLLTNAACAHQDVEVCDRQQQLLYPLIDEETKFRENSKQNKHH